MDRFSLAGKVAMVTGASSGFGAHFARVLAEARAAVVLGARRKERLDVLAAELRGEGHEVVVVAMDVSDAASIGGAFDQAEEALGGRVVDVLINNAGIAKPAISLHITPDDWDDTTKYESAMT